MISRSSVTPMNTVPPFEFEKATMVSITASLKAFLNSMLLFSFSGIIYSFWVLAVWNVGDADLPDLHCGLFLADLRRFFSLICGDYICVDLREVFIHSRRYV